MSYNICSKCGKGNGVVGMTIYSCDCAGEPAAPAAPDELVPLKDVNGAISAGIAFALDRKEREYRDLRERLARAEQELAKLREALRLTNELIADAKTEANRCRAGEDRPCSAGAVLDSWDTKAALAIKVRDKFEREGINNDSDLELLEAARKVLEEK